MADSSGSTKPVEVNDTFGTLVDTMLIKPKFWRRFYEQQYHAKERGIEFIFTYDTWLEEWTRSGHFNKRGRKSNEYCMARGTPEMPDVGRYAPGEVRIITNKENFRERMWGNKFHLGFKDSEETIRKKKQKRKGQQPNLGKEFSYKWRQNISKSLMGNQRGLGYRHSLKTRKQMSINRKDKPRDKNGRYI